MAARRGVALNSRGIEILESLIEGLGLPVSSDGKVSHAKLREHFGDGFMFFGDWQPIRKARKGIPIIEPTLDRICELLHFDNWRHFIDNQSEPSATNLESDRPPAVDVSQSDRPSHDIPYAGTINFVGRQDKLKELHQALQTKGRAVVSAAGMGGVGKTELAIQYAKQYQADYPGGYCWLNLRDSTMASKIFNFAKNREINIPVECAEKCFTDKQRIEWFWRNWMPSEGMVLVILDDVTDWAKCVGSLPAINRFHIIITTRLRNLDPGYVTEISLDVLSIDEAIHLLMTLIGKKRIQHDLRVSKDLCKWLGNLPLALQLMGRYLARKPNMPLEKVLRQLKEQRLRNEAIKLSQQQIRSTLNTAQLGVEDAFNLSWKELNPTTKTVAKVLCFFPPNKILWDWIELTCKQLPLTEEEIEIANEQLYEHHLINLVDEHKGSYHIHPLIREFIYQNYEIPTKIEKIKDAFASTVIGIVSNITNVTTGQLIVSLTHIIPLAEEVAQNLTEIIRAKILASTSSGLRNFIGRQSLNSLTKHLHKQNASAVQPSFREEKSDSEENLDIVVSLNKRANFYQSQGLYQLAKSSYLKVLKIFLYRSLISKDCSDDVANILQNLARLYYSQGRYNEAEPLYKQALEMSKRLYGDEHPHVAANLHNLARLYKFQGRYNEAEPLYKQAVEMSKRLYGDKHPAVATNLHNLAHLYYFQGRYNEAEPLYEQALEMSRRLYGDGDHAVATNLYNLAHLYKSQGRYSEAEPLWQQALEMRKCLFGNVHPDVANILHNLAHLYKYQGRYSEAEPLYQQALEMSKRLYGNVHPDVTNILRNLAHLYKSQGRYNEAEPLYQALEMSKRLYGDEHPEVAANLHNLAHLYYSQGRYNEAEPLYQQALEMSKHLYGDEHPDVANILRNLAHLYYSQGRYNEAEPLYQTSEISNPLYRNVHPDVATFNLRNLAHLYYSQGRYNEAEPLYQQALEMSKRLHGDEHPHVAANLSHLASLYYSQGRYNEAEPLWQQALEMSKHLYGDEHPHVATSLRNLADLYYSQGRYNEAEPLWQQALEMSKRLHGDEHPDVATNLHNLARLYKSQGRYNEAEP